MRTLFTQMFFILTCLSFFSLKSEERIQSGIKGVTFPKEISFSHEAETYQLELTGMAIRKKFFVKVYCIASYIEKTAFTRENLLREILNDRWAKQLTIQWIHDGALDKVKQGYLDSFQSSLTSSLWTELQPEIAQYLSYFKKDVKEGDTHILRWLPGGKIEVIINDSLVGKLENPTFAKALWGLWFSSNRFVNRDDLLSIK
ncbi:hypothetical protein PHSC3_000409 [Chlamydiales bacterium STE3]|nr:hypothetical protein PHSC3_000409 [Chlamydiales bacterium STE3]